MEKNSGSNNYGFQPSSSGQRGYQPTNPGNGYQPTTSSNPPSSQPAPPSTGSSVQK